MISSIAGLTLSQAQTDSAVYIILGIVGLIGAGFPDKISKHPNPEPEENDAEQSEEKPVPVINQPDDQPTTGWGDKS